MSILDSTESESNNACISMNYLNKPAADSLAWYSRLTLVSALRQFSEGWLLRSAKNFSLLSVRGTMLDTNKVQVVFETVSQ